MEFDIEANVANNIEDMYTINITEKDSKNQEINSIKTSFETFKGKKQMELKTNENTKELKIEFYAKYENINSMLTINSLKLNDKEVPLEYKYVPTKLVQKFKNISINYKTAQERIEMINNALELSKYNFLTGIGGEGWQYKYEEVQGYNYTAKKIHSYPAKVILEFGIVGIISYLGIILFIIKKVKKRDAGNVSLIFAVMIIILHSFIDMDMEYAHILVYVFALIATISNNIKTKEKENKIGTIILNIFFTFLIGISIYQLINIENYDRYKNISELLTQRNGLRVTSDEYLEINRKIAQEYEKVLLTERYGYIFVYNNILDYYINSDYENKEEILEKYYAKIKGYENNKKNNSTGITSKIRVANEIIKILEEKNNPAYYEITEKFADIIIDEYEETKEELERYLEEQYKTETREIRELANFYEIATRIKDKYLLGVNIINNSEIEIKEEDLQEIQVEIGQDVLIYHTHGTESYKSDIEYKTYKFYRSMDSNYNVIKIGNHLKQLLKEKGFNVIHETEYFDLPSTAGAYDRAKKRVSEILADNENINVVFDVHRDAVSEKEHLAPTVTIEEKKCAKLRFVIGIQPESEDWMYDLKLAIELQKRADEIYPGLFLPILIRKTDYNQDISKYALLIEVGENCNMLEEAINSVDYFGEIVSILTEDINI